MANDAATIGATASNYQGNAALGGGSFGFGKIDTRPIEDLAKYTMLYNRAEYEQRQKDAEATAKEIADATSYDLTSSIPKDAKLLQEKYDALLTFMRDNPDATNYRNKEQWAKYKTMRNDLQNDLNMAKVRSLLFDVRKEQVANEKNPQLKAFREQRLKENVEKTDIRTPIDFSDEYDISPVLVTAAPIKKVQVTAFGKNFYGQDNWELPDMDAVNNQAITLATGLDKLTDFETQSWFIQLSPDAQARVREQNQAQLASGKLEPVKSAEYFNDAVKSLPETYYKTDEKGARTLDFDKLKQLDNGLVRGVIEQVEVYNRKMEEMVSSIKGGHFKDNFGNELHFGNDESGLKESTYKKINLDDGLTPEELIKLRILGASAAPERNVKITETDIELKRQRIAQDWAQIGLERDKINMANAQSVVGADAVLNEVRDAINLGKRRKMYVNGKEQEIIEIASPNILKEFATIDKDGNMVNRPDIISFNKTKNQLSLLYFKKKAIKDEETDKIIGYEDVLDKKGHNEVDRQVPINPTEWFGQIAKRKFSADDAGPVNNFVDQIYGKFDRDLMKLSQGYRGGATTTGPDSKQTQSASSTRYNIKGKDYTEQELLDMGYNIDQIKRYRK